MIDGGGWITRTPEGVLISVKVSANAKRDEIALRDGILRISVKKPAQNGRANEHLLRLLKKAFGDCELVSGQRSHKKMILVKNALREDFLNKLSVV
ncbi:MAG: DUF167 domain-containing protein [Candidatus Altiarchaeota archaeon]